MYHSWQSCFPQFQADGNLFAQTKTFRRKKIQWTSRQGVTRVDATFGGQKCTPPAKSPVHIAQKKKDTICLTSDPIIFESRSWCAFTFRAIRFPFKTSPHSLSKITTMYDNLSRWQEIKCWHDAASIWNDKKKIRQCCSHALKKASERQKDHQNKSVSCNEKKPRFLRATSNLFRTVHAMVLQSTNQSLLGKHPALLYFKSRCLHWNKPPQISTRRDKNRNQLVTATWTIRSGNVQLLNKWRPGNTTIFVLSSYGTSSNESFVKKCGEKE